MKHIYLLTAISIALTSCSSEEFNFDDPVAAQISASISETPTSRAVDKTWDDGDEIGVTMVGRYDNIKYTYSQQNEMFDGDILYFKNKVEPATLTAYYPFTGNEKVNPGIISTSTSDARQTPQEQTKFDFMYACEKDVVGTTPNVQFLFSHMMSKLTLTFVNGNDGTDVSKIVKYQIDGLLLDGTFNCATGECKASGSTPTSLTINPPEVKDNIGLHPLILFPQSVAPNTVQLTITDSEDQIYKCMLNFTDNKLISGNNYQYTIKVKKTELKIDQVTIAPWIDKDLSTDAGSSE